MLSMQYGCSVWVQCNAQFALTSGSRPSSPDVSDDDDDDELLLSDSSEDDSEADDASSSKASSAKTLPASDCSNTSLPYLECDQTRGGAGGWQCQKSIH